MSNLYDTTKEIQNYEYSGVCLLAADEPANIDEDLKDDCWRKAIKAKLESIKENNTWMLSELPRNQQAIGLKWVFKVKRDQNVTLSSIKQGLLQRGMLRLRGWIMRKCLHMWLEWKQ
jgi:hypothetical protein